MDASAGLCLLPDRYGYEYGQTKVMPELWSDGVPVFTCEVGPRVPIPSALPTVVWRRGVDLNPIDLSDGDAVEWLNTLVWPGQEGRAERLRAAIALAQADPPIVVRGNYSRT